MSSGLSKACKTAGTVLLFACATLPVAAQAPIHGLPQNPDPSQSRALRNLESLPEQEEARKAAALTKLQFEFYQRLDEFAKAWNVLMKNSESGVWNPKQAKETHQAFERLVKSRGWIEHSKRE